MNTLQAMKGYEHEIINAYGLPPVTGSNHYKGECPLCGKKGKFRLHEWNGAINYICVCGSGNLLSLIVEYTGKDFKTIADEIDKMTGRVYESDGKPQPKPTDDFIQRFNTYSRIRGTQAEQYFFSRGIFDLPQRGVRYGEHLLDQQGVLAGMVAVAADEHGRACYEHRTYLKDGAKAKVETVKKMRSICKTEGSIAVRMFDAATTLGIAEGIETALSAHQLYKMPVWSVLNSTFMKKFRAPTGVENLYIMSDNDKNGAGLAAAFECGNRNILSKNDVKKVVIRWPEKDGDFNDVIMTDIKVIEWVLTA